VLLAADGLTGPQIAERAGCTEPTVIKWRRQYAGHGLAGLEDAPRPGGPKTVLTEDVIGEILAATVTPPPEALREEGLTHWSARRLAAWLAREKKIKVSHDSITRLWRRFCLQPHRSEGFKFGRVWIPIEIAGIGGRAGQNVFSASVMPGYLPSGCRGASV
jgi:transposase